MNRLNNFVETRVTKVERSKEQKEKREKRKKKKTKHRTSSSSYPRPSCSRQKTWSSSHSPLAAFGPSSPLSAGRGIDSSSQRAVEGDGERGAGVGGGGSDGVGGGESGPESHGDAFIPLRVLRQLSALHVQRAIQ